MLIWVVWFLGTNDRYPPVPVIQIDNNRARQKATTARPLTVHTAAIGLGLTPLNLIVWAKTNAGMGSL